jgi:hypothetical protein
VGAGAILYLAFSQVAGVEERSMVFQLLGRRQSPASPPQDKERS